MRRLNSLASSHALSSARGTRRPGILCLRVAVAMALFVSGCGTKEPTESNSVAPQTSRSSPETDGLVVAFCGDCHAMPSPESFPKHAWPAEVERGYGFYFAANRSDLQIPVKRDAIQYFVDRAPEQLVIATPDDVDTKWASRFRREDIYIKDVGLPAVSFMNVLSIRPHEHPFLAISDMRGGGVYLAPLVNGVVGQLQSIGTARHPAAINVLDWDQDGFDDLLVCDLGTFLPEDHDKGRVVLLQQQPDQNFPAFAPKDIISGRGRIAAVEPIDVNADGKMELLIAEFGWHTTGSIQCAFRDGSDSISFKTIDTRPGTIHLKPCDLNEDRATDFVALVSQEYETIVAFINNGNGQFNDQVIYKATDPSFGSSGIELSDVNNDGRLDVIYTNGDSFDSFVIKPYHGVRWLENRGGFPFHEHLLGALPGAHRAVPIDLSERSRNEIIATSFLPQNLIQSQRYDRAESIVMWQFEEHGGINKVVLSNVDWDHATVLAWDLNNDGKQDFVVGHFREGGATTGPAATIWFSK